MVTRFSGKVNFWGGVNRLEYLDALPFPLNELVPRRAAVCDYCFFGSPKRTTPLIPTS